MKKAAAWLLSALLICTAVTGFVFAEGDDISGPWGDLSKVSATLAVEGENATVTVANAEEVVDEICIIVVVYGAGNRMVKVGYASGAATAVKTATVEVPAGATQVKAFVLHGETGTPLVANQIWNA